MSKWKEQLADINLLTWLIPYIRHRTSKTNITDAQKTISLPPLNDIDNENFDEEDSHEEYSGDEDDEEVIQDLEDAENSEYEKVKEGSGQTTGKSALK